MSIPPLITAALHTRKQFGIGLWRQFCQAGYLRFSPCKLDPWEYFFFRVFLDHYPLAEKRRFIGWRREIRLDQLANTKTARDLANDKLAFHSLLDRHSIPLPKILAVYGNSDKQKLDAAILRTSGDIALFLQDINCYPLFIKPVRGTQGKDVYALHGIVDGDLQLQSGQRLQMTDLITRLVSTRPAGILFQELLHTPAMIEAICGRRLTSVRVIVIVTPAGAEILSAVWRVPTGDNITDNFNCGRTGNIIANIELATGRVQNTVRGIGWKLIQIDRHPDTDIEFGNLCLPDWQETCSLCLDAAKLFPDLHLQHWDIALTNRGPVVLEMNVEGGMRTHQIVQQRGLYNARLHAACEA
jgi:glutathione synthase/RimK-type ligase-like ATP-grasp enzyme